MCYLNSSVFRRIHIITVYISKNQTINLSYMDQRQLLYAVNQNGYYETHRQSDDPAIVLSKQKNVTLSYRTCNQIFKGQSFFTNPAAEQYFIEYQRKRAEMEKQKSQITADCSQMGQTPNRSQFFAKTQQNKRKINSNSSQPWNKENILLTNSTTEFRTKKQTSKQDQKQNKMSHSFSHSNQKHSNDISKNLFATNLNNKVSEVLSEYESQNQSQASLDKREIRRLRRKLQIKQAELDNMRKQVERMKIMEKVAKYETRQANWIQQREKTGQKNCEDHGKELKKQLGGTLPAIMYLTLFMVLFAKHTVSN